MAGSQAEVRCGTSACAIYTRQSNNFHTDLISCQIQFEACDSFIRSQKGKRLIRCTQCGHIMSTHITRHGSKLYRYYRCRSISGGRIPCSGTQIPAGKMEKKVDDILTQLPESVQGPLITEEIRCVFLQFSAAWSLLASQARQKVLPQIIQEITYNPNSGRVTMNLNLDGLRQHDGTE